MRRSLVIVAAALITSIVATGCGKSDYTNTDREGNENSQLNEDAVAPDQEAPAEVGLEKRDHDQSQRQDALQTQIDSLKIGISTLDNIKTLLGEPESLRKGVEWRETLTGKNRTMYHADYPSRGLSFSLFTNPSRLYSITVTAKGISVHGLRIGDTLESVRTELSEEGAWRTTDAQDWWWLEFEKCDLKIGFDRDRAQKKYPIELAKPEIVTRIQMYNSRVTFR